MDLIYTGGYMIKLYIIAVIASALATLAVDSKEFPDSRFTNAHFCSNKDSDFKEYRYRQNIPICERNVNQSTKSRVYNKYKISVGDRSSYTIDHLIPLSLGGSNNEKNLWPQPKSQSTVELETRTYNQVRNGDISIQEAINIITKEKYP